MPSHTFFILTVTTKVVDFTLIVVQYLYYKRLQHMCG